MHFLLTRNIFLLSYDFILIRQSCFICNDGIFYWYFQFGPYKNWIDAVKGAPCGCILAPISDLKDLGEIANVVSDPGIKSPNSGAAWVGVYREAKPVGLGKTDPAILKDKNYWKNIDGSTWPVTTSNVGTFWKNGEPNNEMPEETAVIYEVSSGKLLDKAPSGQASYSAIYKCCLKLNCFNYTNPECR